MKFKMRAVGKETKLEDKYFSEEAQPQKYDLENAQLDFSNLTSTEIEAFKSKEGLSKPVEKFKPTFKSRKRKEKKEDQKTDLKASKQTSSKHKMD